MHRFQMYKLWVCGDVYAFPVIFVFQVTYLPFLWFFCQYLHTTCTVPAQLFEGYLPSKTAYQNPREYSAWTKDMYIYMNLNLHINMTTTTTTTQQEGEMLTVHNGKERCWQWHKCIEKQTGIHYWCSTHLKAFWGGWQIVCPPDLINILWSIPSWQIKNWTWSVNSWSRKTTEISTGEGWANQNILKPLFSSWGS